MVKAIYLYYNNQLKFCIVTILSSLITNLRGPFNSFNSLKKVYKSYKNFK